MWTLPSRLLPEVDEPVAAWDDAGLYVAMRMDDGEWIECTEAGDPVWGVLANVPILRTPNYWTHFPGRTARREQIPKR